MVYLDGRKIMPRSQAAKITLNFPPQLLGEVDKAAGEQKTTRSDLIRNVLEEYIRDLGQRKLKQQLAEGYRANAALLSQTSAEFKFVDGENI